MKSPFTGKDMEVVYETRTWNFRGEQYEYTHAAYRCVDTGEQFTSEEMEEAAYLQVANQYRKKHGLPFTDEIVDTLFNYYLEHQESLVKEYEGKYLIITNEGVVGAYDSLNEGYEVALKTYSKGNFILQLCSEGEKDYSQRFHTSRVVFENIPHSADN